MGEDEGECKWGNMKENTSGEDEGEYKIVAIVDSKKLIFTPERRF